MHEAAVFLMKVVRREHNFVKCSALNVEEKEHILSSTKEKYEDKDKEKINMNEARNDEEVSNIVVEEWR